MAKIYNITIKPVSTSMGILERILESFKSLFQGDSTRVTFQNIGPHYVRITESGDLEGQLRGPTREQAIRDFEKYDSSISRKIQVD